MSLVTITAFNPLNNNMTSTTINVEQIIKDSATFDKLNNSGKDWKRYKVLEECGGFGRFHTEENTPEGQWITLLWSVTSGRAINLLELPKNNTAENKALCSLKTNAIIWVGKHIRAIHL